MKTSLNDYPEFVESKSIINGLQAKLNQAIEHLNASRCLPLQEANLDDMARHMLDGHAPARMDSRREAEDQALQTVKVLRRSIEMAQARLSNVRAACSRTICAGLEQEYALLIKGITDALQALSEALAFEAGFHHMLENGDVLNSFPRINLIPGQTTEETLGCIDEYLNEVRAAGYTI